MLDIGSHENSPNEHGSQIRRERIRDLLDSALRAEPEDRERLLRLSDHDKDVVDEVRSLLSFECEAGRLETGPFAHAGLLGTDGTNDQPERRPSIAGFTLGRLIGQGAHGIVYEAQEENPRRRVAVKLLRYSCDAADAADRLRLEAHLIAHLEHPLIARVYRAGVLNGPVLAQPYIVMEYVEGESLADLIANGDLPDDERLPIVLDVFRAIQAAHANGVIHRDIKPSNVLVARDGNGGAPAIKVIDFGIAKFVDGDQSPVDVRTLDARALGTLRYMSPERRSGDDAGATVASDVYSLGVLAAEVLGRRDREAASGTASEGGPSTSMADLSEPVRRVIATMTDDNPGKRYGSVAAATEALLEASATTPGIVSGTRSRLARVVPGKRPVRFGLVATCMLMVGVLWLSLGSAADPAPSAYPWDAFASRIDLALGHIGDNEPSKAMDIITEAYDAYEGLIATDVAWRNLYCNALEKSARETPDAQAALAFSKMLEAYIQFDPTRSPARDWGRWFSIATGYLASGDIARAQDMLRMAIDHPGFARLPSNEREWGHSVYGGILLRMREYRDAETQFRLAIEAIPEDPNHGNQTTMSNRLSSLGVVLDAQGRHDEASNHLEHAYALATELYSPMNMLPLRISINRALNSLYRGEHTEAAILAEAALPLLHEDPVLYAPEIAECRLVLATVDLALRRHRAAAARLEGALAAEGMRFEKARVRLVRACLENALGEALLASGSREEGERLIRSSARKISVFLGPTHPWHKRAAERWRALGGAYPPPFLSDAH